VLEIDGSAASATPGTFREGGYVLEPAERLLLT
jgi:hypothetical protein